MKAEELRIGNWVSHEDYSTENFRVRTIRYENDGINDYVIDTVGGKNGTWSNVIDLVTPIPLTEDLLLKCGFEKVGMAYKKDVFIVNSWSDGRLWLGGYGHSLELKHLHQLQNLYYALTNKELEIKFAN